MLDDFCIFILTHGRPHNQITVRTLRTVGYTGELYFVVDNEDKEVEEYKRAYGDQVIVFDKKHYADNVDEGNNFDERRTITHARNACFDIAESLGIKYFMQLDDDYTSLQYRYKECGKNIDDFNKICEILLNFFINTPTLTLAISQGGDHIGGFSHTKMKRKAMNSFICSTDRRFQFIGGMNEDVNTYTTLGSRGKLFFTFTSLQLTQKATQSQAGGITDMYLKYGTFTKSFTTVMMMPSSVDVTMMQTKYLRLHHRIRWNNTVPKIIREQHKKK